MKIFNPSTVTFTPSVPTTEWVQGVVRGLAMSACKRNNAYCDRVHCPAAFFLDIDRHRQCSGRPKFICVHLIEAVELLTEQNS